MESTIWSSLSHLGRRELLEEVIKDRLRKTGKAFRSEANGG